MVYQQPCIRLRLVILARHIEPAQPLTLMEDYSTERAKVKSAASMKCTNCGSPNMTWSATKQLMVCDSCGNEQAVETANDLIIERSFSEGLQLASAETGLGAEKKSFACQNCGAVTIIDPGETDLTCNFCTSTNVNVEAFANKTITPAGILPFKINDKGAAEAFKNWIGRGWFHPSSLKKYAEVDKMHGIYIPFWTYDADSASSWTAEAGYYYYETETYRDKDGNTQTRQVRRTRWEPASGYYQHWFDDVLVAGSKGIKQGMVQKIYPFPLDQVVNYEAKFLLGWKSEVYGVDVKEGYEVAEDIMDGYIRDEIIKTIPGDTYRNLNVHTRFSNITFKHILLPVWVCAYLFNNKSYQVLINGQTGKIAGQKPISWIKVTLAVLVVAAVAFAIWYFTKDSGAAQ